jgi:hypothetical protein
VALCSPLSDFSFQHFSISAFAQLWLCGGFDVALMRLARPVTNHESRIISGFGVACAALFLISAFSFQHFSFCPKDDFRGGGEGRTGCGNLGLHDLSLTTCGRIVQTLSGGVCPAAPWGAPKRSGEGSTTSQPPTLTAPFAGRSDRNKRVDNILRLVHNSPMRSPNAKELPVPRETSGQTYCWVKTPV